MIIEIDKLESFVEEFMDFNGLSQYYWFDADRGNELEMTRSIYIKFKHYLINSLLEIILEWHNDVDYTIDFDSISDRKELRSWLTGLIYNFPYKAGYWRK